MIKQIQEAGLAKRSISYEMESVTEVQILLAQSAGAVEYTDCNSTEG